METKRALIWNSKTEQDGSHVTAEIVKKENDSTYFMYEGRLTTSKNPDDPDYYIRIRNAKFVPKKKIIAGFSNMYIARCTYTNCSTICLFSTYARANLRFYFSNLW